MTENSISTRHSIMVNVASIQMYCEHFTISMDNQLYEKTNLIGHSVITGKCQKSKRITYVGRVYRNNDPFYIARTIANLRSDYTFSTNYRGMIFHNCIIKDFKMEDKGEDFVYLSLTVATASPIEYNSEDTAS